MQKLNSLELSNKAHERLAKKHSEIYKKTESGNSWIKSGYHNTVLRSQKELKRKLTLEEKKKHYKSASHYYYN